MLVGSEVVEVVGGIVAGHGSGVALEVVEFELVSGLVDGLDGMVEVWVAMVAKVLAVAVIWLAVVEVVGVVVLWPVAVVVVVAWLQVLALEVLCELVADLLSRHHYDLMAELHDGFLDGNRIGLGCRFVMVAIVAVVALLDGGVVLVAVALVG